MKTGIEWYEWSGRSSPSLASPAGAPKKDAARSESQAPGAKMRLRALIAAPCSDNTSTSLSEPSVRKALALKGTHVFTPSDLA
eukprot:scaffold150543_cov39-Tisochrysis_lutea.AAC.2